MRNFMRNYLWKLLKKTSITFNFTSSETMVKREPLNILPELPRLRPFHVLVIFDHMLDKRTRGALT